MIKHSFKTNSLENLSLSVYNTGYQRCESRHTWGPATRDHYLFHYVASGKGVFNTGISSHSPSAASHSLTTGDMFLIFPGQVSYYTADNDDPWEYYWVGFNGTEAQRLVKLTGFTSDNPTLSLTDKEQAKTLLMNIYESRGNSPAAEANMLGHLYLFLGRLINMHGQNSNDLRPLDYLSKALKFIQCNYSDNIGVSDIADYVGISRSQLYRVFITHLGIAPSEYLQKHRINEACSLLVDRTLSVSEVAYSVGFIDPLYFSKFFKKHKGMTPTDYKYNQK